MHSSYKKEYKGKVEKPIVPEWLFWFNIVLIAISVIVGVVYVVKLVLVIVRCISLEMLLYHDFGDIVIVALGLAIVGVFCFWESEYFDWNVGRRLSVRKSGFVEYRFFMPVSMCGFSKTELLITSLSAIKETKNEFIVFGNLTLTDSPRKGKKVARYKIPKCFEDNLEIRGVLEGLLEDGE